MFGRNEWINVDGWSVQKRNIISIKTSLCPDGKQRISIYMKDGSHLFFTEEQWGKMVITRSPMAFGKET